jgi:uncharacterized membrane protein YdbT with pleckstrin-like domain
VAFPRRLLTSGEEMILDLRPHWIALVGPALVTILIIVGWILALPRIPGDGRGHDIMFWAAIAAGVLLFLWYPLRVFIQWITSHFVVTNERLIHRSGLIAKHSVEVPLERINDVRFNQTVLERLIGAGDLVIESAGEFGQERFTDIRQPESVQKVIYEQAEGRNLYVQRGGPPGSGPVGDELARLADLRDRGVLTEEEFQAQKARLLRSE